MARRNRILLEPSGNSRQGRDRNSAVSGDTGLEAKFSAEKTLDESAARRRILGWQARREHSIWELRRKLLRVGAAEAVVAGAIDDLVAEGWVSDRRFADAFTMARSARGYGPERVAQELRVRGVDKGLARDTLTSADCDWLRSAEQQRRKRFGVALPQDRRDSQRQFRFLRQRGFTEDQVRYVLGNRDDD